MPFLAWRNLDEEAVARWAESTVRVPGADLYVEPVRVYPLESVGAHLIGYVGRAEETQEPAAPYHFYLPEMEGRCGIERAFNADLAGEAGGRLIRVDASGFKYDDVAERDPKSGRDIALTIDVGFQRLTEDVLRGERGAAVVLDPRNGDVLAMASAPSFDPNAFSPRISAAALERMRTDRDKPFVNRAISGVYPAGSIFKPVVAFAALMSGRIGPDTVFECPGYLSLGEARIRCWQESGHGPLSLRKAIEQSCNCYFCQAGLQCGYQRICHMAASLGLGRRTHIEIGPEASGLLPSADWKMDVYRDGWRRGDTCNLSIGQGALSVTPLQMAVVAAALANGGFVFRPRLVRESGPAGEVVNRLAWPREATALVRGGMLDVVHGASGSGRRALVDGVTIAGKTGTAEYGPRSRRKKCAWMIAFAPFEAPRYAVALVIEDSISGGRTAAPKVSTLMRGVFEMDGTLAAGGRGAG
jgi:penicillin-binding protein 2